MGGVISPYAAVPFTSVFPSGDTSGTKDAANLLAAVNAATPSGGIIRPAPGHWYVAPNQVLVTRSNIYIDAPGCLFSATGAGDVFRFYDTLNPTTRTYNGGGITGRPIIDGTSAGASSNGVHFGDIAAAECDVIVQGFTGAGSNGWLFDNHFWWTEEGDYRVVSFNNTNHVTYSTSGAGTNSFGYGNYDFTTICGTNQQNGVSLTNGANVYHGSLRMRGNFFSGASATTAAALAISGQNAALQSSQMQSNKLDVQVECSTGANTPTTLSISTSPFCSAYTNYGILDFAQGSGTFTPSSITNAQFSFSGMVAGDSHLTAVNGDWQNINQPVIYTTGSGATGTIPTAIADFSPLTLTGNTTINLNPGAFNSGKTAGGPQRVTIIIKQAAGGGFTVTWPHAGSPTTSAPTVLWAGGTAPTMTATANATDVYDLSTNDGATWYGRATQNVS